MISLNFCSVEKEISTFLGFFGGRRVVREKEEKEREEIDKKKSIKKIEISRRKSPHIASFQQKGDLFHFVFGYEEGGEVDGRQAPGVGWRLHQSVVS